MNPKVNKRMKILFADDGSQHAQAAVQFLKELPLPERSKVFALRVFTPSQGAYAVPMEKEVEKTRQALVDSGLRVESNLIMGYPAEKIMEMAESIHPDLIVLGAKGLRATLGILLGGVAQQVVEYACCPVLVVRESFKGLKKILAVTDGSQPNKYALRYLTKFPLPEKTEINLVHVMAPFTHPVIIEPYFSGRDGYLPLRTPEDEVKLKYEQEQQGKALLGKAQGLLQQNGLDSVPALLRGDAATEIIDFVKGNDIDLIVAGSRGLSRFQGWLLGSVSRKLVHYSDCSVLIVKQPKKAKS